MVAYEPTGNGRYQFTFRNLVFPGQSAFPNHTSIPARRYQGIDLRNVTLLVGEYFVSPEITSSDRQVEFRAIVTMPETAIYKKCCAEFCKN